MKNILKSFLIIFLVVTTACTNKLGKFTAISTNNVRGLEYGGKNLDEVITVEGKSCNHRIYLTRVIVGAFTLGIGWFMPSFDLVFGDEQDDRLTNAVDNAVKSGKNRGVLDGDLLVNASINEKNIIVPLFYGYKCVSAEGEVVSTITRTKGYLEKK